MACGGRSRPASRPPSRPRRRAARRARGHGDDQDRRQRRRRARRRAAAAPPSACRRPRPGSRGAAPGGCRVSKLTASPRRAAAPSSAASAALSSGSGAGTGSRRGRSAEVGGLAPRPARPGRGAGDQRRRGADPDRPPHPELGQVGEDEGGARPAHPGRLHAQLAARRRRPRVAPQPARVVAIFGCSSSSWASISARPGSPTRTASAAIGRSVAVVAASGGEPSRVQRFGGSVREGRVTPLRSA